jgi:hypothetical protein
MAHRSLTDPCQENASEMSLKSGNVHNDFQDITATLSTASSGLTGDQEGSCGGRGIAARSYGAGFSYSDYLCDSCTDFCFGELIQTHQTLDIYLRSKTSRSFWQRKAPDCRICTRLEGLSSKAKLYRYDDYAPLDGGKNQSRKVAVFCRDRSGHIFAFVHKVPAVRAFSNPRSLSLPPVDLASKWIKFCQEHHDGACGPNEGQHLPGFKVIDCISKRICMARPGHPYVALSYVWGPPTCTPAHQILGEEYQTFPRTIEDALLVARRLRIRYLWVDRYCIDQKNNDEKHTMISNMDKIYASAELTIVAAAGLGPHHGLPGVSTTPRLDLLIDRLSNGSLLSVPMAEKELSESYWNTRGWTYQEMLLSRRRLVFTDSQMIFQCCTEEFRDILRLESPYGPTPCLYKGISTDLDRLYLGCAQKVTPPSDYAFALHEVNDIFPTRGIGRFAHDIYERIGEYTLRNLSKPEDILNAIEGVFGAFRRSIKGSESHFWGIPVIGLQSQSDIHQWTSSLVTGLAWYVSDPADRRLGQWPSWSWTTVQGRAIEHWFRGIIVHPSLECTMTHRIGAKISLLEYVQGRRHYEEYNPWIDLTTWVLEDCKVEGKSFSHPRFDSNNIAILVYFDVKTSPCPARLGCAAVFLFTTRSRTYFLVAQETGDDVLRRVGVGYLSQITERTYNAARSYDDLRLLPAPSILKPQNPFNEWKLKTVRLV